MEITALETSASSQLAADRVTRGKGADSNDQAFERARDLTAQQQMVASTLVTLSAEGGAKNAVADVQSAGRKLAGIARAGSIAEIRTAAADLVDAYNKADRLLSGAKNERQQVPPDGLRQAADAAAALGESRQVGIAQAGSGTLTLDTAALEAALSANADQARPTVTRIGETLATGATRQLAAGGEARPQANRDTPENRPPEARQAPLPEQVAVVRRNEELESRRITNAVTGGVAAYQKVLGG